MTAQVQQAVQAEEPSSLRISLTLGVAGLLAGLALAMAYQVTLPTIEANKAQALRAAVYRVVPGAGSMKKLVRRAHVWSLAPEGDKSEGVLAAYDQAGELVGYALVGEGPGFQDTIRLLVGYDPKRQRIVGMEVLDSRETPGLGDKIYKDPAFRRNFDDLSPLPEIVVVKENKTQPNEVDAITGATISSRAVVKIVNATCTRWLDALSEVSGDLRSPTAGAKD